ncbi:MAG: deoxyribodipyrimidine photolyase [Flammeovirgaceae bacterium]|jgi:deoxyribodipyrimidine photo-lyase|nr:deoxyribodipyrimidine photolyase [Flammeovirgaceae bacterium]
MIELFPRNENKISFPKDYSAIIERVNSVDPLRYGNTRNFIDGAVTYLSPYISRGVVSVKQVQESVLSKGYPRGTMDKFLQELAWREYFQRVWQAKGDLLFQDLKQPQTDVLHHQMVQALVEATTGIDAIDKSIREFYNTGYLHNHVRMYVASIACNMGKAHWLAPAQWMYYNLLDGDLASNTCSWQWVAGAFSSKKYYCNQENINRFTNGHQHDTFLDLPVEDLYKATLPDTLKSTRPLSLKTLLPDSKTPSVDTTKPTLIYNSYNLDPLWRKDEKVNRILLLEPSHFQKFPVSEKVIKFILNLSKNIPNIQLMIGEVSELEQLYVASEVRTKWLISKEHPAFSYYTGQRDARDWLYPEISGYYNSFFSYWKKCEKMIKQSL